MLVLEQETNETNDTPIKNYNLYEEKVEEEE